MSSRNTQSNGSNGRWSRSLIGAVVVLVLSLALGFTAASRASAAGFLPSVSSQLAASAISQGPSTNWQPPSSITLVSPTMPHATPTITPLPPIDTTITPLPPIEGICQSGDCPRDPCLLSHLCKPMPCVYLRADCQSVSPSPDVDPPTAPGDLSAVRTRTSFTVSWGAATDNVGVSAYEVSGPSSGSTTSTSYPFSGLTCNTGYDVGVNAVDAAGNRSQQKTLLVTTEACPSSSSDGSSAGSAGGGTSSQPSPSAATKPDPIMLPTKLTPLKKPPALPKVSPPKYGVILGVKAVKITNGFRVSFHFGPPPLTGATVRTTWYYNNKPVGEVPKKRSLTVATFVRSASKLPAGYWRCALGIKLPRGEWRTVREARFLQN